MRNPNDGLDAACKRFLNGMNGSDDVGTVTFTNSQIVLIFFRIILNCERETYIIYKNSREKKVKNDFS